MPDVSVIIPNYNGSAFLAEAIDSALAQEGVTVEVIVVDDGSTDDSRSILESYGDRIRSLFQENKGASAARNNGLALARSNYVKFLDADDWLIEKSLSKEFKVVQTFENSEHPLVVFGDALEFREGREQPWSGYSIRAGHQLSLVELIHTTMLTPLPLHLKNQLLAVGGFDTRVPSGEDFDLSVRLHLSGVRFIYQPGNSFVYRQHDAVSRVSTGFDTAAHFRARHDGYLRIISNIRDVCSGKLSEEIALSIAKLIWETGRFAARSGHVVEARRLFEAAIELTAGAIPAERLAYRFCCRCFGPILTERLLEFAR